MYVGITRNLLLNWLFGWFSVQVLPPGQPQWGDARYKGSFRFCFWQRGQWTDVTIDDRLPCINSTLCFSCCHAPGAFWVALLEKAYAKLATRRVFLFVYQIIHLFHNKHLFVYLFHSTVNLR